MIARIVIENFKSFKRVDLKLGRLNQFVGTNANGKSNLFDARRTFQGIGNVLTRLEVLDAKPRSATSEVWEAVRGGSAKASPATGPGEDRLVFDMAGRCDDDAGKMWQDRIEFLAREGRLRQAKLSLQGREVFDSSPINNHPSDPVFEAWLLAGHRDRMTARWADARDDHSLKERVFEPRLRAHGDPRSAGGGREALTRQTLTNYRGLLQVCPELAELEHRLRQAVHAKNGSARPLLPWK